MKQDIYKKPKKLLLTGVLMAISLITYEFGWLAGAWALTITFICAGLVQIEMIADKLMRGD